MGTKNKRVEDSSESWWARHVAGQRRNLCLLFFSVGALTFAAWEAWKHWGASHAHWEKYTLGWENVSVSPPPPWVRSDVKGEVSRGDMQRFALRDYDLTRQVAQSFSLHPWVAQVRRVSKSYPANMQVDLEYRKPVAMVEVEHEGRAGLLPIDRLGVLLPPDDFTTGDAKSLPRIRVQDSFPAGTVGSAWGDERVAGAALIAELLVDQWSTSPLFCIVVQPLEPGGSVSNATYELITRSQRTIIWGRAPYREASGEHPAQTKLQQLWLVLRQPGNEPIDLRR